MPEFQYGPHEIHYLDRGNEGAPVIAFVNGVAMRAEHWNYMAKLLCARGYRVVVYDMLGQGGSSKPILAMSFQENADVLAGLLDHLGVETAYISGISFGGVVALKFAYTHPAYCRGLIPMSTFVEIDGQLSCHAWNLHQGLSRVGFEYYLDLFMPLNFTSAWIEKNRDLIAFIKRASLAQMEVYSIQNLMESLAGFKPIKGDIAKISCPTWIINGEYDALTPRHFHDDMRQQIKNSRLVIIQKVAHALTMEVPELCCQVIAHFVDAVESGSWEGDQTVWIAASEIGAEPAVFPCVGDHMRALPIRESMASLKPKRSRSNESSSRAAVKTPLPAKKLPNKVAPSKVTKKKPAAKKAALKKPLIQKKVP